MLEKIIRKLKDFIHQHDFLDRLAFFLYGLFGFIRAKIIFRKIKKNTSNPNTKRKEKILIIAIRAMPYTNLVYFDAIFGHAFKKLGCSLKMLYCDGVLDSCDADTAYRNQKAHCFACQKFGTLIKDSLGLDCLSFKQYITEEDIKKIEEKASKLNPEELLDYQYLGVNVGDYARASTNRFYLSGQPLNLEDSKQVAVLRKKLVNSMFTTKVAHGVYLKEKPTCVFSLHGVYSTWGPFFDYFRNQNIDVFVYNSTATPLSLGRFVFTHNGRGFDIVGRDTWNDFKTTPLSQEEESKVDAYFSARLRGEAIELKMFEKNFDNTPKETLIQSLNNKKYLRRYVLFSNLTWDSVIDISDKGAFENIFAWIDQTIDYFKKHPNYQLIIKPHPSELIWERKNKRVRDYILEHHPNLPENIKVLKADTPLLAYDLVNQETISLVFGGTLGLELAAQGLPLLNTARSHYSDAGVSYHVKTLEDYLSSLDNSDKIISFTKTNQKLAKKYAYFYLFRTMVRIPFYRDDKWSVIDWNAMGDVEKLLGENSNIIKICKKIINKEDVVYPL